MMFGVSYMDYPRFALRSRAGEAIQVVEGERCVHALRAIGITATTNEGGAGKWRHGHSECLRNAKCVVIWPDSDAVGATHAGLVGGALHSVGVGDIRIATLPGVEFGDIAEWIGTQWTTRRVPDIRADVLAVASMARLWAPGSRGD